jgi:hypothetical protein
MKKLFLLCVASTLLVALNACSAGSASSNQTVSAQTTHSNSSLSGTYSVTLINAYSPQPEVVPGGNNNFDYTGVGTIQLNGSGSITGGTLNLYIAGASGNSAGAPVPCPFAATGTYSVQSTASGTATLNLSSSTAGCVATETWQLAFEAADSGNAIQFVKTGGDVMSGSAIKQ